MLEPENVAGNVVAVASQKGGVGKTTLPLNLGYALARRGWKTLLVDADPQGCLGLSIRGDLRRRPGLAEVLNGRPLAETAVTARLPQLSLLLTREARDEIRATFLRTVANDEA